MTNQPKPIRVLFTDVDGTLTDGFYHVRDDGHVSKSFYTRDFAALAKIRRSGVRVVVLSQAGDDVIRQYVETRKVPLNFTLLTGVPDKLQKATDWLKENGFGWDEVAYIGDAENDIECLKAAAWSACPSDAEKEVADAVHFVADNPGGRGAVEEFVKDLIAKGKFL